MTKYAAGSVEKNGITVPIFVDDAGHWTAEIGGGVWAANRDQLALKIAAQTKKATAKVSVPFTRATDGTGWGASRIAVADGVATGFHSANGNILVTWTESGTKEQFKGGNTMRPLDADQKAEFVRLAKAVQDAQKALREFDDSHKIDLRKAVEEAQNTTAP